MNAAARATWAPGCGSRQGSAWRPWETCISISSCQAGWNSTSSTRLPKRSWVRSFGGFSLASRPSSIVAARAGDLADGADPVDREVAALAGDGLDERPVGLEDVVVGERRRLVGDRVGRVGRVGWTVGDRHDPIVRQAPIAPSLTLPCGPR